MIGTITGCVCVFCQLGIVNATSAGNYHPIPPMKWTDLKPPEPALPRFPSVAALMKARMLALIQVEMDQPYPSFCRLREAVERMDLST